MLRTTTSGLEIGSTVALLNLVTLFLVHPHYRSTPQRVHILLIDHNTICATV